MNGGEPGREDEEHGDEDQGDGDQLEDGGNHDDAEDAAYQTARDRETRDDEPGYDEPAHFLTDSGQKCFTRVIGHTYLCDTDQQSNSDRQHENLHNESNKGVQGELVIAEIKW